MLGIEKSATEAQVKNGFKKKAVKVHPDKNGCPKANEAFQKINQAMATLSDPQKRRVYDQVGQAEAYESRERQGRGGGGN
jgi:DnaJ-class molecular chaperone